MMQNNLTECQDGPISSKAWHCAQTRNVSSSSASPEWMQFLASENCTASTPMGICCSYRCGVRQHRCTATVALAKCCPHCSVLLCKTGSQQACVTASTPMEICCSYKVCSEQTPMHCNTVFGKMKSTLLSAALQNRLTAGLCHCKYTYGDLLFIQGLQ